MWRSLRMAMISFAAAASIAAAPAWDPAPWLADLAQIRAAIERDYPNLEWLTREREVSLDRWFARTADEIRNGGDDAAARRALDKLVERFNDGHLALRWPTPAPSQAVAASPAAVPAPATATSFCAAQGYVAGRVTPGTAAALPGYRAIDAGGPFPAGLVDHDGRKLGVVRIAQFDPQAFPVLCEQAVGKTGTPVERPCDEGCADRILTEAYAAMTRGLATTAERLRAAGAEVLLVDLTRNGGGTEWAEAAARTVSPVRLQSAPVMVMPGESWATRWHALSKRLRMAATGARPADRAMLADLARQAGETAVRLEPCKAGGCPRLVQAGFASGLVAGLPAGQLDGREWGPEVFSPAQFPYRDHAWKGPLIVLVDDQTWSAAEQFAALLQDNGAAVVMGTRTGGAGCGHLYGNEPVTLPHSGAKLEMPNCVRLRKDGSNEVGGVIPDVPTGVRWNDGPAFAGRITSSRLGQAVTQAEALSRSH